MYSVLSKSSNGPIETTVSAFEIPDVGCVVRTTTVLRESVSETTVFVPCCKIEGGLLVRAPQPCCEPKPCVDVEQLVAKVIELQKPPAPVEPEKKPSKKAAAQETPPAGE